MFWKEMAPGEAQPEVFACGFHVGVGVGQVI